MDATNTDLLSKLRSAANREASLLTGLSGEIVAATTHLSRLYAQEREAERRLSAWPGDPRRNSMSPDERNALDNAKVDRRTGTAANRKDRRASAGPRTSRDAGSRQGRPRCRRQP